MHYARLDPNQQRNILEQRLTQYEAEHYSHSLNLELLQNSGSTDDATQRAIADAESAMATLEQVHNQIVAKLQALDGGATPQQTINGDNDNGAPVENDEL